MSDYVHCVFSVFKREGMLFFIASLLLVVTPFIWMGIPMFKIGTAVASLTTSSLLVTLSNSFFLALFSSLYFLPIHFKIAQEIAKMRKGAYFQYFIVIELLWVSVVASITFIILRVVFE